MSIVDVQAGIAACAEAQRRNGAAAGRRRLLRDRVVARSRIDRDDANLPPRPPRIEGSSPVQAQAVRARKANPLSSKRPPARLPGCAVDGQTMPNGTGTKSARRLANGPERRVTSRTIRHSSRVGINLLMPHAA